MIITKYKSFMIKSWEGKFELCGSTYLLKIAYDASIQDKNSMRFGLVERI